jgi:hypothetical protein
MLLHDELKLEGKMRSVFPGHFRPTNEALTSLWNQAIFAVDANVLLNFYRYSFDARHELGSKLNFVKDNLFIPHQAAKEFLNRRLSVTAGQANEYRGAIRTLTELHDTLSNQKKHPFLTGSTLSSFDVIYRDIIQQLESQEEMLMSRLSKDEILDLIEKLFHKKTGTSLTDVQLKSLALEGEERYKNEIPPGYRDGKKDASGDPFRKYGDLIIWKQIINKAKEATKPVIFVTDDKKDDWWLEQSGRTIGPRAELLQEFIAETSNNFWMYTVDRFIAEAAHIRNTKVNAEVIAEIRGLSEEAKSNAAASENNNLIPASDINPKRLSGDEILQELKEFLDSHPSEDRSVGLKYFVTNYLGSQNYEIKHSYGIINFLADTGYIELFETEKNDRIIRRIRLV